MKMKGFQTSKGFCTSYNELKKAGVEVQQRTDDADYNFLSTACTMTKRRSVAVVRDDTNLLVHPLHHLSLRHHVIFLKAASKILSM